MRTALVALNLLVATASAGVFAYTFFAREHLIKLAEGYVIAKTVQHVTPTVDQLEALLKHPLALLAPAHIRDAVWAEVNSFRRDPHAYVRALVTKGAAIEKPKHALADLAFKVKEEAQGYFDRTLAEVLRDVRIFTGTNVVGALLAAFLATRARGRLRWHVLGASILLTLALALQMYMFIDGLTFFRIIMGARVGWSYPIVVALTFGYLYYYIGRFVPLAPEARAKPTKPNPSGPQKPPAVR